MRSVAALLIKSCNFKHASILDPSWVAIFVKKRKIPFNFIIKVVNER